MVHATLLDDHELLQSMHKRLDVIGGPFSHRVVETEKNLALTQLQIKKPQKHFQA